MRGAGSGDEIAQAHRDLIEGAAIPLPARRLAVPVVGWRRQRATGRTVLETVAVLVLSRDGVYRLSIAGGPLVPRPRGMPPGDHLSEADRRAYVAAACAVSDVGPSEVRLDLFRVEGPPWSPGASGLPRQPAGHILASPEGVWCSSRIEPALRG